jgi:hypothetical protein
MKVLVPALILGSLVGLTHFAGVSANPPPARGSAPPVAAQDTSKATTPAAPAIVYNPPRRGAPRTRTGGGTRTAGDQVAIAVLAPEDTGLTTSAQPTFYWQLSSDTNARFEFVLSSESEVAPLWRTTVTEPLSAGVHALSVEQMNVKLTPGVLYRWSVALVRDPAQRSNDIVSSGTAELVDLAPDVRAELDRSAAQERPAVYAAHGLWYDAVHSLNALMAEQPADAALNAERDALLAQAKIEKLAVR